MVFFSLINFFIFMPPNDFVLPDIEPVAHVAYVNKFTPTINVFFYRTNISLGAV